MLRALYEPLVLPFVFTRIPCSSTKSSNYLKLCETTFKGNSRILNALYIRNKNFTQQMLETTTCSKLAPSCSSVSIRYLESASLLITAFAPAKQLSPKLQGCLRARHHLPLPFIIFSSFSIFFFYFFLFSHALQDECWSRRGEGENRSVRGATSRVIFIEWVDTHYFALQAPYRHRSSCGIAAPIATSRYVRTSSAC